MPTEIAKEATRRGKKFFDRLPISPRTLKSVYVLRTPPERPDADGRSTSSYPGIRSSHPGSMSYRCAQRTARTGLLGVRCALISFSVRRVFSHPAG